MNRAIYIYTDNYNIHNGYIPIHNTLTNRRAN